ncbi:MAG: hypothetical protein NG740_04905 [Omnitrophica bacterium]|nr:hypothetical protein [Candidatus Omnitrophota bacterium]
MKKVILTVALFVFVTLVAQGNAFSDDRVLFGFEKDVEGWGIPDWAYEQDVYVGEGITSSTDVAKEGKSSMRLDTVFPGKKWAGAVVEIMEYFDWTPYSGISCDVYLPGDAPKGLKAKIILTVGDSWKWTEMSRAYKLTPGEWTSISANFKPGSEDWKRTRPTDEFRADVRKIAIRIETSNKAYKGPVYIDNVVLGE